jgi:hypothetical protein
MYAFFFFGYLFKFDNFLHNVNKIKINVENSYFSYIYYAFAVED